MSDVRMSHTTAPLLRKALLGELLEVMDAAEALYGEAEKHLDAETSTLIRSAYNCLFEARVQLEATA